VLSIRKLIYAEIHELKNFPPEDWNLDLPGLFSFHFGHSYFYPIVAELNTKIVGCGIAMVHGDVSWLGTIIVAPEYRRQGIGEEITRHLMEHCRRLGCTSQLLTASEMGETIYRRLGFETKATYVFYKRISSVLFQPLLFVREAEREDTEAIKELDRDIIGENRSPFLERFLSRGWVYAPEASRDIRGVYLPDFGSGLILANDAKAGLELMKLRLSHGITNAIVPSTNLIAREFLRSENFQEYRTAPRMVLGNDVSWQPTMLYNRATGYCG
jgi:GNAT superfamily N-acetyltransferase